MIGFYEVLISGLEGFFFLWELPPVMIYNFFFFYCEKYQETAPPPPLKNYMLVSDPDRRLIHLPLYRDLMLQFDGDITLRTS